MKFLRWLLFVGVMVGVGYAAAARWLFPGIDDPTDVEFTAVPGLTGVPLADAEAQLAALGFVGVERGQLNHIGIATGSVIAQSPLPGQLALPGDTVTLTTSAGPELRVVPDLAGLPTAEAATLLTRLGFAVDVVDVEGVASVGAIRTEPEAGVRLQLPAQVRLHVSRGRAIVSVPDLLGLHVDDLATVLGASDLGLGTVQYQADARDVQGRVVFQSPDPGTALRGDGLVSVIVAGIPPDPNPDPNRGANPGTNPGTGER